MHKFRKHDQEDFKEALPGVDFRTLVWGESTHMTEFHIQEGSQIPMHSHPHEQTGYLVPGRMTFTIEGDVIDAGPGDCWNIPGGVEHGVEVLEDAVVLEIFSPVREDYLP